ncbi:MAG: hypothetical protein ABIJ00_09640 [Candidatus Eisenbacteria bacterium]
MTGGVRVLQEHRDGRGRWRRFPYYYTLLALVEGGEKTAVPEMRYAAPGLERMLKRSARRDRYDVRRRELAQRVLELL